jgi:hypothetical protein
LSSVDGKAAGGGRISGTVNRTTDIFVGQASGGIPMYLTVRSDIAPDVQAEVLEGQQLAAQAGLTVAPLGRIFLGIKAAATSLRLRFLLRGFSAAERSVVLEARAILSSSEFAALRAAQQSGQSLTINVGGRTIQYEAGFTYAEAMTLGEVNGFVLGPKAFASPLELARTLSQELFRLQSGTLGYSQAGAYATQATQAAFEFAQRAGAYVLGL